MKKIINRLLYNKYAKNVTRARYTEESLRSEGYYSQYGQDKYIAEILLPNVKNGIFVDIGANDGQSLSNTLYFEEHGWRGIAIEPNPICFKKLSSTRKCITINGAISDEEGMGTFRAIEGYANMLSGLVDAYDERHLARIEREIREHGGGYEDIEVKMLGFNKLMDEHGIAHVDYLSLDVEGLEMKILESIDFAKLMVSVITVENNYNEYHLPKMLSKRGFKLHALLGGDNVFINTAL